MDPWLNVATSLVRNIRRASFLVTRGDSLPNFVFVLDTMAQRSAYARFVCHRHVSLAGPSAWGDFLMLLILGPNGRPRPCFARYRDRGCSPNMLVSLQRCSRQASAIMSVDHCGSASCSMCHCCRRVSAAGSRSRAIRPCVPRRERLLLLLFISIHMLVIRYDFIILIGIIKD